MLLLGAPVVQLAALAASVSSDAVARAERERSPGSENKPSATLVTQAPLILTQAMAAEAAASAQPVAIAPLAMQGSSATLPAMASGGAASAPASDAPDAVPVPEQSVDPVPPQPATPETAVPLPIPGGGVDADSGGAGADGAAPPSIAADESLLDGRRRPGEQERLPERITQDNPGAVRPPPPEAFPVDQFPIPDRWRLVRALCPDRANFPGIAAVCHSPFDPYHQNFLKGDIPIDRSKLPKWLPLPIKGNDWFIAVTGVSDTVVEPRSFPIPNNRQLVADPNDLDVFGRSTSIVAAQTFIVGASLIKGSTAFMPPTVEYRLVGAYQINHVDVPERRVLNVQPSRKTRRTDSFFGIQEAFVDYHFRNVSDRYDFDSIRIGIQPFQADFRGFLFNDNQFGVRFFGNRDNNRFQYNLAMFWRLEKDSNSGLNDVTQKPRDDLVFFANLYRQDFPINGLTGQISFAYNLNRERDELEIDKNGFPVRPVLLGNLGTRDYDVFYLGYNADGRIGRLNLTASASVALGRDSNNFFTGKRAKIRAGFAAAEASYDVDWMRFRLSGLYATGDGDPFDNKETGYDAIFENPIFAGADTSYFIRQTIPFAGGGRVVNVSQRNGLLNNLRSSKEQGQSNFNNPGTMLLGVGGDFDITPKIRLSANVSHIWFENTSTLRALRNEGSIPKSMGTDFSLAAIYRPTNIQNVVFRLSGAVFDPGKGFSDLFTSSSRDDRFYSVLFNAILSF